jgi:hypothetical protein
MKYFSNILDKINKTQRVLALVILSVTIILLTLGSLVIKTLRPDDTALRNQIDIQNQTIKNLRIEQTTLNKRLIKLNGDFINGQMECTDRVVKRELEITKEIDNLIMLIDKNKMIKKLEKNSVSKMDYPIIYDENGNEIHIVKSEIEPIPTPETNTSDDLLIIELKKIKKKISKNK